MNDEQKELAREVVKWARHQLTLRGRSPRTPKYDQDVWFMVPAKLSDKLVSIGSMREGSCKTDACLAGYTAILTAPADTMVRDEEYLRFADGTEKEVWTYAAGKLGLDHDHAMAIFYSDSGNALERLEYLIEHPETPVEELRELFPSFG